MSKSNSDILNLSDEEFSKLSAPPETDETPETPPTEATKVEETPTPVEAAPAPEAEVKPVESPSPGSQPEAKAEEVAPEKPEVTESEDKDPPAPVAVAKPVVVEEAKPEDKDEDKEEKPEVAKNEDSEEPEEPKNKASATVDPDAEKHAAFYKAVLAPIKANGKVIQLESAEEVIQLIQMGANYTKKMQALQSGRKLLMMLEQNGLLDENKLSFYIDLEKRNPEAIKKFLKDSKIDPVDIDTSGEVNYKSGSHAVTEQEVNLHGAIEDLTSMDGGKETLQSINTTWDQASKKDLWDHPEILAVIHAQRVSGIYDRITTEIERRKVLGQIGPNVPFLRAYKSIGDELAAKGALQPVTQPAPTGQQPVTVRTPVAVRPAKTSATKVTEPSKVKAAAAPRTIPHSAKSSVNFLAMSDDDFNKLSNKVS